MAEHAVHTDNDLHHEEMDRLMKGRDTRFYKKCLARLTLCVLLALITSA